MYRRDNSFEIKSRLHEINRQAIQLFVASSELADLAAQLARLRKLNETIRISANRRACSNRRRHTRYSSTKRLENNRGHLSSARILVDEV